MIGTTLERDRGFPIAAVLLLASAMVCCGVAISQKIPGWAIFGIWPAMVGAVLLFHRPGAFRADITTSGLYLPDTGENIPFSHIDQLWFANSGFRWPVVHVFHNGKVIKIPPCRSVPADDVYDFLKSQVPPERTRVNPELESFLHSQTATFGSERVWAHNARPEVAEKRGSRALFVILMSMVVGIAWIAIGISIKQDEWGGAGAFLLLVALIGLLLWFFQNTRSQTYYGIKNWQAASLVISPTGLALLQGDLIGQLRWTEVIGLKFKNSTAPRHRRVEVRVEGAQILVRDIYKSSLSEIYQQIEHYWQAG